MNCVDWADVFNEPMAIKPKSRATAETEQSLFVGGAVLIKHARKAGCCA